MISVTRVIEVTHDFVQIEPVKPFATDPAFLQLRRREGKGWIGFNADFHEESLPVRSRITTKGYA